MSLFVLEDVYSSADVGAAAVRVHAMSVFGPGCGRVVAANRAMCV